MTVREYIEAHGLNLDDVLNYDLSKRADLPQPGRLVVNAQGEVTAADGTGVVIEIKKWHD